MPRRTERIASLIRAIVADAIQTRLSDPRIEPLTSVTRVEVSPDLSVAHVRVSVMAEPVRQKLTLAALSHASGRLRSYVARGVRLRQVPRLEFRLDDSIQRSFQTVQELDRIMEAAGDRPGSEPAAPDAENDQHAAPEAPAADTGASEEDA